MRSFILIPVFCIILRPALFSQNLYFPPLSASSAWDTVSPASLGWCVHEIDSLYSFLQQKNSKAFMVLKNGKIVLEKYFGTFTKDSLWYWASAGKTITSFLIAKAQEEHFLSINDTSSTYLNAGWTYCTPSQEKKIRIRHQLTMTTGLDDGVPDNHCTLDSCLIYKADAGTRWAYHNAPYTLLESVLTSATGTAINSYTQNKLKLKTGMNGFWITSGYDNVYYSSARSMARFGLLFQNNCIWNSDTLLHDANYVSAMTNTSQNLNLSYGYLWWLNGKASYMVPTLQTVFPGFLLPHAPADAFSAMGKNGQFISVSKTKGLVFVRIGNAPSGAGEVPFLLCDQIWEKLNAVMCESTSQPEFSNLTNLFKVYPNPASTVLYLQSDFNQSFLIEVSDIAGKCIIQKTNENPLDISSLDKGVYFLKIHAQEAVLNYKFIKN